MSCVCLVNCGHNIVNISDIKQRRITMSNVQQQRMVVEQLRREASIKRISVSQAVEDIKVA